MTTCETPHDVDAGIRTMAENWITIWESELACLATDREAREAWLALAALWAAGARAAAALLPDWPPAPDLPAPGLPANDPSAGGPAGAGAQTGAAAPAAASDARDAAIARLAERVAELERRLAHPAADPGP